ncbi:MAG: hypothetical protein K2O37_05650, partial [Bacteroidales bacterium]|nr:hypothetical protein [Bacteroidales bacterium]
VGLMENHNMHYAYDTVQVRGADTSLIIVDDDLAYWAATPMLEDIDERFSEFQWHKQSLDSEIIGTYSFVGKTLFNGTPPVLAYRPKAGCWSVTDKVVTMESLSLELQGQGRVKIHSGITYCEVDTPGKTEQFMGRSEVLHFEVRPAPGYYLDRVEIGNGAQMRVVSECDIQEKDGVFSFRDFPIWDYTTTEWSNFFITEDYRIVLKEGEKKTVPVCEDTVKLVHYDGCVNIGVPDTLLLRVENPVEGATYRWQLPDTWKPIGCTTCAELRVSTQETAAATRIYGVSLSGAGFAMDTVQVRGADTTIYIAIATNFKQYGAILSSLRAPSHTHFDLEWYKEDFSSSNLLTTQNVCLISRFEGFSPLLKYRIKGNNTCWSVTDKITDSPHSRLVHYDGCVNIGMESELLLRVENPLEGLRYHWQIPETWEPIGDTNGSELRVITHETKDTTRIYGVKFADFGPSLFDTVQVKGADTTNQVILDFFEDYLLMSEDLGLLDEDSFEFLCYKGRVHPDSTISGWIVEDKYRFNGTPPVFAYRPMG